MITGVNHITLAVRELERSFVFYTELLGLTLVHDGSSFGMVFLRAGSDNVILARSDAPLQRSHADSRRAHHAFKIDPTKYEDAKRYLASEGVEVFEEENRTKGVFVGRQFYIRDPDGNVIEFSEWDGTSILD